MINIVRKDLFLTLFLLFAFCIGSIANASLEGATDFISKTSDNTLSIVSDDSLTNEQKEDKLNNLFETSVDIDWIAKFVMGRYWREATDKQKKQYTKLYRQFLLNSYVPKFKKYTNQKIIITNAFLEDEMEYLVQTEIKSTKEPSVRVDYKIKKLEDGNYIIFDIIAEGISMITTQRSEFSSILSRRGVKFLIKKLKDKVS